MEMKRSDEEIVEKVHGPCQEVMNFVAEVAEREGFHEEKDLFINFLNYTAIDIMLRSLRLVKLEYPKEAQSTLVRSILHSIKGNFRDMNLDVEMDFDVRVKEGLSWR